MPGLHKLRLNPEETDVGCTALESMMKISRMPAMVCKTSSSVAAQHIGSIFAAHAIRA